MVAFAKEHHEAIAEPPLAITGDTPASQEERSMPTVEQCEAYAAECQSLGRKADVSIQRATALMGISQSWTVLASQLRRLADILKEEGE
jgi:hypothetical protein